MTNSSNNDYTTRCNAYHEAGHAVAAVMLGFEVVAVDIRPIFIPGLGQTLGSAELALPSPQVFLGKGEDAVMPLLVVLLAGAFAEHRVTTEAELDVGHEESDGQRAMKYAAGAICKPITRNGILVTPGDEVERKKDAIRTCIEKAMKNAEEFVNKHGAVIDSVGEMLAALGVLTPTEVEQLIAAAGE